MVGCLASDASIINIDLCNAPGEAASWLETYWSTAKDEAHYYFDGDVDEGRVLSGQMNGMSRAWIYGEMKNSRFPSSIRLSERSVVWVRSEVEAWIEYKTRSR